MKKTTLLLSLFCSLLLVSYASAQDAPVAGGPPPFLLFEREELKPGTAPAHDREAHNFARFLAHAKNVPGQRVYYRIALTPLAGNTNEVIYLYPFASLEAWAQSQQDIAEWISRPGPMQTFFMQANQRTSPPGPGEDAHASQRSWITRYRPDLSYNPRPNVGVARFMQVTTFRAKPGEWMNLEKAGRMIINGHREAKMDIHFATFQLMGGGPEGVYIVVESLKSIGEMMPGEAQQAALNKAMGGKWEEFNKLMTQSVMTSETHVYAIRPTMSHVPDEHVRADPAFWNQPMPPPPAPAMAAGTTGGRATAPRRRQRQ